MDSFKLLYVVSLSIAAVRLDVLILAMDPVHTSYPIRLPRRQEAYLCQLLIYRYEGRERYYNKGLHITIMSPKITAHQAHNRISE